MRARVWIAGVVGAGLVGAVVIPLIGNDDPTLHGTVVAHVTGGGQLSNSCEGTGGDLWAMSLGGGPWPMPCGVVGVSQEAVTADRPFVVNIGGRETCHPGGELVRLNPEAVSPVPSVTAWTVEGC